MGLTHQKAPVYRVHWEEGAGRLLSSILQRRATSFCRLVLLVTTQRTRQPGASVIQEFFWVNSQGVHLPCLTVVMTDTSSSE